MIFTMLLLAYTLKPVYYCESTTRDISTSVAAVQAVARAKAWPILSSTSSSDGAMIVLNPVIHNTRTKVAVYITTAPVTIGPAGPSKVCAYPQSPGVTLTTSFVQALFSGVTQ